MVEIMAEAAFQRRSFWAMMGIILSAWVLLLLWSTSPYSGLLDHRTIGEGNLPLYLRLGLFLAGWMLMVLAMMLPGSFLLVGADPIHRIQPAGRKSWAPAHLFGYIAIWIAFGAFIYLGDVALHEWVERVASLEALSVHLLWALVLIVGGYQFTPAKRTCLQEEHCPNFCQIQQLSYRYNGRSELRLGLKHGLYCLGNCWGLMLLMFAVGSMNLLGMLGLTAVMATEHVAPTRWQFSRWVGLFLIALALVVALRIL